MTNYQHGTDRCYTAGQCRRDECRKAHNKAARDRRRQQAYGRYTANKRNSQAALNHINKLRNTGITLGQIHKHTQVSMHTLGRITLKQSTTIQANTEQRILNYNPGPEHANPNATTNTPGTARRLQALQYNGWDQDTLAQKLGLQRSHVWKLTHQKTGATHAINKRITTLYNHLWDQQPAPSKNSNLARTIARRNGWLPALCWDEDKMDDPTHTGYPMELAA